MPGERAAQRPAPREPGRPKISYLVGRLDRALRRRLVEALVPFKLSVAQYTALSVLHTRGELSNAQLASRVFISPQSMNEVIQVLETRRLVTRRASSSHGRIVQLLLTARGLDVMHQCDVAITALEQAMLAGLNAAERVLLEKAFVSCTRALENKGPQSPGG